MRFAAATNINACLLSLDPGEADASANWARKKTGHNNAIK
jgi:hypothetical protein